MVDVRRSTAGHDVVASGTSELPRRRRLLGGAMVVAVAISGLGIGAAQVIKSPAQAAADTAAPPPSVITAPVERRVLKDSVIVRGTVAASQTLEVTPSGSGQAGAGAPVVTKILFKAGDTFRAGQVLAEVSGRPVIALKGTLPVYRDLKPGADGDDVDQLQRALKDTGHPVTGDREGYFGPATKAALASLYRSVGYDPLPAVAAGEDTVSSAQDGVTEARRHLQDVLSARPDSSEVSGGKSKPLGDQSVEVSRAQEDVNRAEKKLAQAKAASGPMLPASEVVYLKALPARVDNVGAAVGDQVSKSVMTVSAGRLVVTGYLSRQQRGLVRPGQRVQILSELDGTTAGAVVRSVADSASAPQAKAEQPNSRTATGGEGGSQGYAVTVVPDKELASSLGGQDVRLTIEAAATKDPVLVVPVTAISAGADGATAVTVAGRGDTRRRVPVTTGASGDGYVEVRAATGARLAVGEKVITGAAPDGGAPR